MSKSMVDRLFIGAIVAVIAGWVVGIVAIIAAIADGAVVIGGPNVVTVSGEALASVLVVLAIASLLVAGGTDRWGGVVDRRPIQHGPPRRQDVVCRAARPGDLELRLRRDGCLCRRRARSHWSQCLGFRNGSRSRPVKFMRC